jgi:hypothetical protein
MGKYGGVPQRAELEPDPLVPPTDGRIAGKRGIGSLEGIFSIAERAGSVPFQGPIGVWNRPVGVSGSSDGKQPTNRRSAPT